MTNQTALPNAADFCTVAWAAERTKLSQRHVRLLVQRGKLTRVQPRTGSRETGRRHTLLMVCEVEHYAEAREVVRA